MDVPKLVQALALARNIINSQQAVINQVVPIALDLATALRKGTPPTPEQVAAWDQAHSEVNNKLKELTGALKLFHQASDHLLKYDA
jgi:hypothetical protein